MVALPEDEERPLVAVEPGTAVMVPPRKFSDAFERITDTPAVTVGKKPARDNHCRHRRAVFSRGCRQALVGDVDLRLEVVEVRLTEDLAHHAPRVSSSPGCATFHSPASL